MARRVNTKFLIGLVVFVLALTGVLMATYAYMSRTNSQDDIEAGMLLYEQRRYREASVQFGKALAKERRDLQLILRYADCVNNFDVRDTKSARNYIDQVRKLLLDAIDLDPGNPEPFERWMQLMQTIAIDLNSSEAWNAMYDRASGTLSVRPDMTAAQRWRAIATAHRAAFVELNEEELRTAEEYLRRWAADEPNNSQAIRALVTLLVNRADRMAQQRELAQTLAALRGETRAMLWAAVEANPADLELKLDLAEVLLRNNDLTAAAAVTAELEAALLQQPQQTRLVLRLINLLPMTDRGQTDPSDEGAGRIADNPGLIRAVTLLEQAAAAAPKDIAVRLALGRSLRLRNQNERAMEALQAARSLDVTGTPLTVFSHEEHRLQASAQYLDLLLATLDTIPDATARQARIDQAADVLRQLKAALPKENPSIVLLQGKLELAQGKLAEALITLDRANGLFNNANPEAAMLSAVAQIGMGELGAAMNRLQTVVSLRPSFVEARRRLAQLHLQMRQFPQAQDQAQQILELEPGDPAATEVLAVCHAQAGQTDKAIAIYEQLLKQNDRAALPLAQLLVTAGRKPQALAVLQRAFEKNPTDLALLQRLAGLSEDPKQTAVWIAQARAADKEGKLAQSLGLIEKQLGDPEALKAYVQEMIANQQDPLARHLGMYRFLMQTGKTAEARRELEQAARVRPDDPAVVEALFEQALASGDLTQARQLAERAKQLNLDQAQGAFFEGRVALQANQPAQAIALFKRGLSLRPVYSEGWRSLGEAQQRSALLNDALNSFKQAVAQRPDNVRALVGRATTLAAMRRHREAIDSLTEALQFAPRDANLRNAYLSLEESHGDAPKALAMREQLARTEPSDHANRRALALARARGGQLDSALADLDRLIQELGPEPANLEAKALVLASAGRADEARQLLQQRIHELGPKAQVLDWVLLAQFLDRLGDSAVALSAYQKAIELEDPQLRPVSRELADRLFDRGENDQAIEHYRRVLTSAPDDTRVLLRLAEALLRSGEAGLPEAKRLIQRVEPTGEAGYPYRLIAQLIARANKDDAAALRELNAAIEQQPNLAPAYLYRADLRFNVEAERRQVYADLNRAIELDPTLSGAYHLLATAQLRDAAGGEAAATLERLLQVVPNDLRARARLRDLYAQSRSFGPLRKLLADSRQLFPTMREWVVWQAELEQAEGKLEAAAERYREVLKAAPSVDVLLALATVLVTNNRAEEALATLREYPELVSAQPLLQGARGMALAKSGQTDPSLAAFAMALRDAPSFQQVLYIVQMLIRAFGEEAASSHLRTLVQGERAFAAGLVLAQVDSARNRFQSAYDRLAALRVSGPAPELGSELQVTFDRLFAVSAQQVGDMAEAQKAYERLLEKSPDDLQSLNNLAFLFGQVDQPQKGLPLAERAHQLSPRDAQVLDTLGYLQLRVGKVDEARQTLQSSVDIKLMGQNALHLGQAMLAFGDRANAVEWFRIAQREAAKEGLKTVEQQAAEELKQLGR